MVKFTKIKLIVLFGFSCCLAQVTCKKIDAFEYDRENDEFQKVPGSPFDDESLDRPTNPDDTYRILKNDEADMKLLVLTGSPKVINSINGEKIGASRKASLINHLKSIFEREKKLKVMFLAGKDFRADTVVSNYLSRWLYQHRPDNGKRELEDYIKIFPCGEQYNEEYSYLKLENGSYMRKKLQKYDDGVLKNRLRPFIGMTIMTIDIRDITDGVDASKIEITIPMKASKGNYVNEDPNYHYIDNSENVEIRWILSQTSASRIFLNGNRKKVDEIVKKMIATEKEKDPTKKILVKHVDVEIGRREYEPTLFFEHFLYENGPKDRPISQFNKIWGYGKNLTGDNLTGDNLTGKYYDTLSSPGEKIEIKSFDEPDLVSCFEINGTCGMTIDIRDITNGVDASKIEITIPMKASKGNYVNEDLNYHYIDKSDNVEIRWILSQTSASRIFLNDNAKVAAGIVKKMIAIEKEKDPTKKILVKHVDVNIKKKKIEPVILFQQFLYENGPKDRPVSQFNKIWGYGKNLTGDNLTGDNLTGKYYDTLSSPGEKIEIKSFDEPDLVSCFEKNETYLGTGGMTIVIRDITNGVDPSKIEKKIPMKESNGKYKNEDPDYDYTKKSKNVEIRWILSEISASRFFLNDNAKVVDGIVKKMIATEKEKDPTKKILVKHVDVEVEKYKVTPVVLFLQFLYENGPKDRPISQFNKIWGYDKNLTGDILTGKYYVTLSSGEKIEIQSFGDPDLVFCFEKHGPPSIEVIPFDSQEFVHSNEFEREKSIAIPIESEKVEDPNHKELRFIDGPSPEHLLVLLCPMEHAENIFSEAHKELNLLEDLENFANDSITQTKDDVGVESSIVGVQLWSVKNAEKFGDRIAEVLSKFMQSRGRKGSALVRTYLSLYCFGPFRDKKYVDKDNKEFIQMRSDSMDKFAANLNSKRLGKSPGLVATIIPRPYPESSSRRTPTPVEAPSAPKRARKDSPKK